MAYLVIDSQINHINQIISIIDTCQNAILRVVIKIRLKRYHYVIWC
ncbi:hypothetical protein AO365_0580 [Moraxella catarrhalis]|nr:hypothetical protein AO365_0580 [Moraxella catarrhalis]